MSTEKKTQRIDSIPPELCTMPELEAILGIKRFPVLRHKKRFSKLRFAEVFYQGKRIHLFNRAEVEALRYKGMPKGYILSKEAAALLGVTTLHDSVVKHLTEHGIKPKWVKAHHSYRAWKKSDIEAFARTYNKKPDSRHWLTTTEAAELLYMSQGSVHRFARQGLLKSQKVGCVCYFSRDSVEKLIESRK